MSGPRLDADQGEDAIAVARVQFRTALINARKERTSIGDVEAAAARFCLALKRVGRSPEATLIVAKEIIEEAIDGEAKPVAERAVLSCIQHYYRE